MDNLASVRIFLLPSKVRKLYSRPLFISHLLCFGNNESALEDAGGQRRCCEGLVNVEGLSFFLRRIFCLKSCALSVFLILSVAVLQNCKSIDESDAETEVGGDERNGSCFFTTLSTKHENSLSPFAQKYSATRRTKWDGRVVKVSMNVEELRHFSRSRLKFLSRILHSATSPHRFKQSPQNNTERSSSHKFCLHNLSRTYRKAHLLRLR